MPSAYQRITRDLWVVQGHYGQQYGWEDVDCHLTSKDGREALAVYNENEPQHRHRLIRRREKRNKTEAT